MNNRQHLPPPLPEQKLFLGGVADWAGDQLSSAGNAIGDAATSVGDFVKENPAAIGTALGVAAAPFTGGASLATLSAGASLGGAAGSAASKVTGDATGAGLKRKRRREKMKQKRAERMSMRRALRQPIGTSNTAASQEGSSTQIVAHGGYIENKFAQGGSIENIGQDAKKVKGPKHKDGGVHLDPQTEVEGGETMDKVNGSDYVFSKRLSVPNKILPDDVSQSMSFADYHEHLVENNASQSEIDELAAIQERVAGRDQEGGEIGANRGQDEKNHRQKHLGPLGNRLQQMAQSAAHGGKVGKYGERKMEDGGYYAVKASETEGDEPKYPINSADDVKDAWKLRNHGDYDISQSKLEERIKRKAREYDVNLNDKDEKAYGGSIEKEYQEGGFPTGNFGLTPNIEASVDNATATGGEGFLSQAGDFAQSALPYLPAIMNTGRALFEDSEVSDVPYTPPAGRAENTIQRMETDVDTDPQIAAVDKNLRSILAQPDASLNQKRAAASQAAQQKTEIESQAENRETGLQNEMISRLASAQQRRDQAISQGRTQAAQAERRQQMKADAREDQLLQTGLSQAASTYQKQQQAENQRDLNKMRLATVLARIPPEQRGSIEDIINDALGNRNI